MPANESDLIQPKTSASEPVAIEPTTPPAEAATPAPDAESQASSLSPELLKLPTLGALMSGSPPAASGSLAEFQKRPEAKIIAENKEALLAAGFFFYKSLDNSTGVLGNGLYIHPDQIRAADQAGKLAEVAPPFDTIGSAVSTSGDKNPVLGAGNVPEGFATAPASAPPQMSSGPGQPASVQRQTATARQKNMQVGSPTSGAGAGSGTLMRSILKNPV